MPARRRVQRRRSIAGPLGDLFVHSDGQASSQILDGDELHGYPDVMAARSAWFKAREMSWSHPDRPPCSPPLAAVAYDGFGDATARCLPQQMPSSTWSSKKLSEAVRADVRAAEQWVKAHEPLAGIAGYIDDLQALAAHLHGVTDEPEAYRRMAALFARVD